MRLQNLSSLVTTGLLGDNRHYCVIWIHCNSTGRSSQHLLSSSCVRSSAVADRPCDTVVSSGLIYHQFRSFITALASLFQRQGESQNLNRSHDSNRESLDITHLFCCSVPVGRLWKQWLVCYSSTALRPVSCTGPMRIPCVCVKCMYVCV